MNRLFAVLLLALIWAGAAWPQDFKPPPGKAPDGPEMKLIHAKLKNLSAMVGQLRKQGVRDPGLADVEIYYQAAAGIVELEEFFHKDSANWTLEVLDRGALRARFLAGGEMPWTSLRGISVPRGFRSRIDGTVQPYAFTFPKNYGNDPKQKWPLEVWLHGRDTSLSEVKFLKVHMGEKELDLDHVRIDIFGRGNNAYRWAGETDVFEAIDHFLAAERAAGRERLLDTDRIILRGFSMGGAGAWHLGLHWPDRWAVVNPGAGFTTTRGYLKSLPEKLPEYQEACLRIYDAIDYAENAYNVPIFAYSGEKDAQKLAADLIQQRLDKLKIPITHIVAPKLEHKYPPEWQAKVKETMKEALLAGRPSYPSKVRFTTYTLRYPSCHWVELMGLDKHYEKSVVKADRVENGFQIKTTNVRTLRLLVPSFVDQKVEIDGQELVVRPWQHPSGTHYIYLDKRDGNWRSLLPQRLMTIRAQKPQKISGLQGPIDDAFSEPFLCVRGTEKSWHEATGTYADKNLERFRYEWAKFFRGDVPVKADVDVTSEDIAGKNLILFGDPASNSLIAQVLDGLPLTWNEKNITFAGKTYASGSHVPVLIYPNPLNPSRYVLLNSGHTFHEKDFEGTNALLYPRLGDWAVLSLGMGEEVPLDPAVAAAGLFDEYWQVAK